MDVQGKVIESITKILKDRGEIKDSETVTVDLRLDEIESLIRTEAVSYTHLDVYKRQG